MMTNKLLLFPLIIPALIQAPSLNAASAVDYRFSPPEWQTAICLPDDPCKSLVDSAGRLLYHYGQTDREFGTTISVETNPNSRQQAQRLLSARVPIVQTMRTAEGLEILEEAFAVTNLAPNGAAPSAETPRNDMILVKLTNRNDSSRILRPRLLVDTVRSLSFQPDAQRIIINQHETITSSLRFDGVTEESKSLRAVQLGGLTVPAHGTASYYILVSGGGSIVLRPADGAQAERAREQAIEYWERFPLPYGRVTVPDPAIQAQFDSAIRNIWQAREIKNGLPAFQVGPTVYRGLWIVDGAFILESAAILGAGDQARSGIAQELTHQKPDGRIDLMGTFTSKRPDGSVEVNANFTKENGIVLWTLFRHAQLTQDKIWLESVWPRMLRIAQYIKHLRQETLTNGTPLDAGLMPPGFPDGGIGGTLPEYTNSYWNLVGLHAFVSATQWLGKKEEAARWQSEYDDFMEAFRRAAQRDMKQDSFGNKYLPARMDGLDLPQRAQWAFCHAVYPGQIFERGDPMVAGNMAMMEATEREGMVYGTGWDEKGIWNYFGSFYAHAWLWLGNGAKAAQVLYAYANHAAPTLVWREEQSLKGQPFKKVGDMPHNWASAEFIRLVVHLIEIDRGSELHLLEGLPSEWALPGQTTSLNGIATPFGRLTMQFEVSKDGRSARLSIEPLLGAACSRIIVHRSSWAGAKTPSTLELDPTRRNETTLAFGN